MRAGASEALLAFGWWSFVICGGILLSLLLGFALLLTAAAMPEVVEAIIWLATRVLAAMVT